MTEYGFCYDHYRHVGCKLWLSILRRDNWKHGGLIKSLWKVFAFNNTMVSYLVQGWLNGGLEPVNLADENVLDLAAPHADLQGGD
ncbi:hypothetical protein GM30_05200 [Trabulsiella odontotermitis]|nr:hypothetical protein GM30_05200 [Trabulsiella odontotermitis]